jgi:hypothetical protein
MKHIQKSQNDIYYTNTLCCLEEHRMLAINYLTNMVLIEGERTLNYCMSINMKSKYTTRQ